MFRFARYISRRRQDICRQVAGRPFVGATAPRAPDARIGTKLAGAMFAGILVAVLVAGSNMARAEKSPPPPPKITGLVCDGTFQLITGGVDTEP